MKEMWVEWGHRPTEVAEKAKAIRRRIEEARRPLAGTVSAEAQARIDARRAEARRERRNR